MTGPPAPRAGRFGGAAPGRIETADVQARPPGVRTADRAAASRFPRASHARGECGRARPSGIECGPGRLSRGAGNSRSVDAGRRSATSRFARPATPTNANTGRSTNWSISRRSCWNKVPRFAIENGRKADRSSPAAWAQIGREIPRLRLANADRQAPRADDAAQRADAQGPRRPGLHGLRSDDRRLSRRDCRRHPLVADRSQAGREAAGRRVPTRPRRSADGHDQHHRRRLSNTTRGSRRRSPSGASSRTPRRIPIGAWTASARSSGRAIRWGARFSVTSSRSTSGRSSGWRRSPTSIPRGSAFTASLTAARRPSAYRPCCRSTPFRSAPATSTNGSARTRRTPISYSYVFTPEYEMFEWNMGHVANYAELASLMAPRPFMVERGHDDGVAPDEWVAWEYAKVRRLVRQAGLGGPHGDRILQRSAHDPRPGDVRLSAQAPELAGAQGAASESERFV